MSVDISNGEERNCESEAQKAAIFPLSTLLPAGTPTRTSAKPKWGRLSKFPREQDFALVREVAVAGSHVTKHGKTHIRFNNVSDKLNQSELFTDALSWTNVQDSYKCIHGDFEKRDSSKATNSVLDEGELSDLDELLSQMRQARENL